MEMDLYTIGVEKTSVENYNFENLSGVLSDISKITECVKDKSIFSHSEHSINVTNSEFTTLIDNIEESNSEVIIFYFSGHGCIYEGEHYLVLKDRLFLTKDLLTKSRFENKHFFLILDCCFSGKVIVDYDFCLKFESSNENTSKTIFSASEKIALENDKGGYFTRDLLDSIKKCKENMNGSLNIDAIFFELMDIIRQSEKLYHVYTNNFFTIDLNCIDPKVYNQEDYLELIYVDEGEIFKIDSIYKDDIKIYIIYINLNKKEANIRDLYYQTRRIYNAFENISLYKNGFEKSRAEKPLDLIYCKYFFGEITANLSNLKYLSYFGDIKKDTQPLYPLNRVHTNINSILYKYEFDYKGKGGMKYITTNNEEIQKNGRAIEYNSDRYNNDFKFLKNEDINLVIKEFFDLYEIYLKDIMIIWYDFINGVICSEDLFVRIGSLDPDSKLINYDLDYKTTDTNLVCQLNMLYKMKKEMDYIKSISNSGKSQMQSIIYNYKTEGRIELLILDCIITLKRNYSNLKSR